MEKIVIQKMQNDGSYIEEYPRTTQEMVLNLLSSSTKSLMGLEETSTADDAFKQLYLANVLNGKSMVELTFLDSVSNKPLSGVIVTCDTFCDAAGTTLAERITDDNGKILAFVSAINPTIKISGYADIEDFSQQLDVSVLGKQFTFSFNLTTNQFKSYLSSQTVKFSKNVIKIDVSAIGGGGGGQSARYAAYGVTHQSGSGGWSGSVTNAFDITVENNVQYSMVIGAGGAGGYATYKIDTDESRKGGSGGQTTFLEIVATGGSGGTDVSTGIGNAKGGAGRQSAGAGNSGQNGSIQTFKDFLEMETGPGGGGGGALVRFTSSRAVVNGGTGGEKNGADGGKYNGFYSCPEVSTAAKGGGGGGGAFASYYNDDGDDGYASSTGGTGGSGVVAIRMHLSSRS